MRIWQRRFGCYDVKQIVAFRYCDVKQIVVQQIVVKQVFVKQIV